MDDPWSYTLGVVAAGLSGLTAGLLVAGLTAHRWKPQVMAWAYQHPTGAAWLVFGMATASLALLCWVSSLV